MDPELGDSRPDRSRSSVDLPEPDSPTTPNCCPLWTSKDSPCNAATRGARLNSELRDRTYIWCTSRTRKTLSSVIGTNRVPTRMALCLLTRPRRDNEAPPDRPWAAIAEHAPVREPPGGRHGPGYRGQAPV